jgi:pilus biogenesis lipoprotein CpaD
MPNAARPILAALSTILLAACAEPEAPLPTLDTTPKLLQLTAERQSLTFEVDAATGEAPSDEQARIARFLNTLGDPYATHVLISGAPAPQLRRAASQIVQLGLPLSNIRIDPAQPAPSSQPGRRLPIQLTAERLAVTPPACPDQTHLNIIGPENANSSNFGCATIANFGAMVADPHDLLGNQSFLGPDGERAAQAVQTYRDNKVRALPERNPFVVVK